jgi:diguanylate cyclase
MTDVSDPRERYAVLDYVPLGVLVLDRDFNVACWNSCLEDWTGIPRATLLGTDVRGHFPHLGEARYERRIADLLAGGAPAVFSSQLHPHLIPSRLRSGRLRVQHTVAVAVPASDAMGGPCHALLAIQDVTNLADAMEAFRLARDEAKHQAATDHLTGIANRRHFVESAERFIAQAQRYQRPCSLLLVDVDRFKGTNDTYGHAVGDQVLCMIVRACRRTLRESDLMGRLGGDEFAAFLPETAVEMALVSAERVRSAIQAEPIIVDGREIPLTVSVGVAALDLLTPTLDSMLNKADAALYEAKRRGRNVVIPASQAEET